MSWHPMVVHFPLVLLPLSFTVDLVGWIGRRPDWHRGAYCCWSWAYCPR